MPGYCITGNVEYVGNGEFDRVKEEVINGLGVLDRVKRILYRKFVGFEWGSVKEELNERLQKRGNDLKIGLKGGRIIYTNSAPSCIHISAESPTDAIRTVTENKSVLERFFGYRIDPEKLKVGRMYSD